MRVKVGFILPTVVVSILPFAEFEPNDHRKDAAHFINSTRIREWRFFHFIVWVESQSPFLLFSAPFQRKKWCFCGKIEEKKDKRAFWIHRDDLLQVFCSWRSYLQSWLKEIIFSEAWFWQRLDSQHVEKNHICLIVNSFQQHVAVLLKIILQSSFIFWCFRRGTNDTIKMTKNKYFLQNTGYYADII